ncbi:hypothetical protein ACOPJQ_02580 [Luteimonas dalianensis]|uniref:hypothetical protein n=1 Tax=Luteimonas dalianensis TaxID=1148196 RepID=UPI003BF21D1C
MSMTTARPLAAGIIAIAAAACSPPPETPPIDEPPEPQATRLHDAIQAPIDKARAVEDTLEHAAEAQRAQVEHASQ